MLGLTRVACHWCELLRSCRCLSPPGTGAGVSVRVSVGRLSTVSGVVWAYERPVLTSASPAVLAPAGSTVVTLFGSNFGAAGAATPVVSIDGRLCVIHPTELRSDGSVTCVAPVGVSSDAVVIMTVDGLPSTRRSTFHLQYEAPSVTDVTPLTASTNGGSMLLVRGVFSAAPTLSVSVRLFLPRGGGVAALCNVTFFNASTVAATVPEGAGTGWLVTVTNMDTFNGYAQDSQSFPSPLSYEPPSIMRVEPASAAGAPAAGGFRVLISGANLSRRPVVRFGEAACVVVASLSNHSSVVCTAPPRNLYDEHTVTLVRLMLDKSFSANAWLLVSELVQCWRLLRLLSFS